MKPIKQKHMAKSQNGKGKPIKVNDVVAKIALTNPAVNVLDWELPVIAEGRKLIYTYINWGSIVNGVRVKNGGVQIYQFEYEPDVSHWENHTGVGNQDIPAGTWDIRIDHFTAVGDENNWDTSTIDGGTYSAWEPATFS